MSELSIEIVNRINTILQHEGDDADPKKIIKKIAKSCEVEDEEVEKVYLLWRDGRMKDPLSSWFSEDFKNKRELTKSITKEQLYYRYVKRRHSIPTICKEYGLSCRTVWNLLRKHNIPLRGHFAPEELLTVENLTDLFVNQKLSAEAIGRKLGCNGSLIRGRLKKYKIQR